MLTQEQIQRVCILLLSTIVVKYLLQYEQDGFLVVEQLLTLDECQKLKAAAHRLIDDWEPEQDYSWIFPSGANKERSKGREMIDSSDKISFFIEEDAVDPDTGMV